MSRSCLSEGDVIYRCIYIYVYELMCVCVCVCVLCVCVCVYICMYVCVCVYIYIGTFLNGLRVSRSCCLNEGVQAINLVPNLPQGLF